MDNSQKNKKKKFTPNMKTYINVFFYNGSSKLIMCINDI